MKKFYFLICGLLITSISFGQVIASDGFDYSDGSLVPNGGWANHSGTAGDLLVSSGQAVVQHGAPSEDANLAFTPVSGNIYFAFDFTVIDPGSPISGTDNEYFAHFKDAGSNYSARVDIVPPSGSGDYSVGIASDESAADAVWATDLTYGTTYRAIVRYNQDTNIAELWIDATSDSDTSILGEDRSDPGDTVSAFALRQSDSDLNEGIQVDNLMIGGTFNDVLVFTASTDPTLFIVDGPTNGSATIGSPEDGGDIDIYFGTTNFTVATPPANDGYIVWEVKNSGGTTIAGGNDYDTSTPNLFNLPQGDTYTVNAELVDPSGASLNPAVIYAITFTVPEYIQVANLAALRASTIGDDLYYQVTGEVIGTFMQAYRNQRYIQDATAGILVDDPDLNEPTTYNIGDGVINIKGQLGTFSGVLQFTPVRDAPSVPVNSTGNIITPEVVTIAELTVNWENYESELVEIKGATFVGASGNFATGTNYTINDGTGDLDFRTSFFDADYIGMPIPLTAQNLVVLVAEFNGSPQVTARELSDLTLRVGRNDIEGFSLYPNPVTNGKLKINTINNGTKEIQIFNILGKNVLSTNLKGKELNVSKLNSGIYILKIQENGKTATRKLVIR